MSNPTYVNLYCQETVLPHLFYITSSDITHVWYNEILNSNIKLETSDIISQKTLWLYSLTINDSLTISGLYELQINKHYTALFVLI